MNMPARAYREHEVRVGPGARARRFGTNPDHHSAEQSPIAAMSER